MMLKVLINIIIILNWKLNHPSLSTRLLHRDIHYTLEIPWSHRRWLTIPSSSTAYLNSTNWTSRMQWKPIVNTLHVKAMHAFRQPPHPIAAVELRQAHRTRSHLLAATGRHFFVLPIDLNRRNRLRLWHFDYVADVFLLRAAGGVPTAVEAPIHGGPVVDGNKHGGEYYAEEND